MSEPEKSLSNAALADEVEALNSIYNPDTLVIQSFSSTTSRHETTAILQPPDLPFSFLVSFPPDYPTHAPPTIVGTQSTGGSGRGEGEAAVTILRDVLGRVWVPGQVCLFDLLEEATPLLLQHQHQHQHGQVENHGSNVENRSATATTVTAPPPPTTFTSTSNSTDPKVHHDYDNYYEHDRLTQDLTTASSKISPPPSWVMSEPSTVNKSTFVARACRVTSLRDATDSISHLLATNKKVAGATHNITAWRIRIRQPPKPPPHTGTAAAAAATTTTTTIQDSDDDGETAAGGRLLHLMQLMDVWDVVVVVTRWYGGVKLGPDRFRLINSVAREALVKGGFDVKKEANNTDKSNKGKGKGKK